MYKYNRPILTKLLGKKGMENLTRKLYLMNAGKEKRMDGDAVALRTWTKDEIIQACKEKLDTPANNRQFLDSQMWVTILKMIENEH